jgi:glucose-6-phosphate dehydrogenase assembly protein OpcA
VTPTELSRFARGEPIAVDVGSIERELDSLWKQTGQEDGATVSRAALWNVVMPARGRRALAAAKHLVDDMAAGLPTRAITICLDDEAKSGSAVNATIESNVVSQPGGARLVYSEEITLTGPAGAEGHFAALARALLIAGVPTALFWIDPSLPLSFLKALLPMTSRLITDTTVCARPQQLFALQQLVARAQPLPITDIGWLRLGSVRAMFAGLFDPPVGGAPLAAATRVLVRHRPGCDASALLLVAWLGVKLDWRPLRSAQTSEGGLRLDFQRGEDPAAEIAVHMVPSEGACGKSGILGMELYAGGDRYAVSRTAIDHAAAEVPIAPPKLVKLDAHADAELCVDALGPRGRDPLFARVLALAGRLWSFEPAASGSRR